MSATARLVHRFRSAGISARGRILRHCCTLRRLPHIVTIPSWGNVTMPNNQPFTDQSVIPYGLLVMHAMDYHRARNSPPAPFQPAAAPPSGQIVGYLYGKDTLVPDHVGGPLQMLDVTTCYGIIVHRDNELVVAIRGTDGILEWIEDAEFLHKAYCPKNPIPAAIDATVEQGFWGIYETLEFADQDGKVVGSATEIIAQLGQTVDGVVVAGHSLGAPLATYLTLDLARSDLGDKVRGCYFASPHPGNAAFGTFFHDNVANYVVYNYVMDIVPRVPPTLLGYQSLPNRRVITPTAAKADVTFDVGCNHHVVCYLAMLDFTAMQAALETVPPEEAGSWACVRGPATGRPSLAAQMFDRIAEVAGTTSQG